MLFDAKGDELAGIGLMTGVLHGGNVNGDDVHREGNREFVVSIFVNYSV